MTETEWDACTDPTPMLEFLRGKASDRKLRLFACACCRRIWNLLANEEGRQALITAECAADDPWGVPVSPDRTESLEALLTAKRSADDPPHTKARWIERDLMAALGFAYDVQQRRLHRIPPWMAPEARCPYTPENVARLVLRVIADASTEQAAEVEKKGQAHFLRDIFGSLDAGAWAWNDGAVRKLTQIIYDEKAFDRLPILADTLEESGCCDAAILSHCRQPSEHVRGCWVVDLLLGKS